MTLKIHPVDGKNLLDEIKWQYLRNCLHYDKLRQNATKHDNILNINSLNIFHLYI